MKTVVSIFLYLVSISLYAQDFEIKGSVTDRDGIPLPGVTILVKNTTRGSTTDIDGQFVISNIQEGEILVFSFIGFVPKEITIQNDNLLSLMLDEDLQSLEEVVIIGYGTQKVSKISGSVSLVNEKTIETLRPVRAEDALQGQATGVNVITSGSPGATPTVFVRGIPSYTGTNPLVVIDGVTQTLDDLNALNPGDIQSMNVLKDAALTAIYGVSGGNGVIVIKTKGGRRNMKTSFNFDSSYSIQEVTHTIDVLNASEYVAILNEASSNAGEGLVFPDISGYGRGTDWQNEVLVNAPLTNTNLSASGGSETTSFYVAGGYLSQEGVVFGGDKSYFNRANATANFNTDLSDKFTFIVNTSYANIKSSALSENNIGSVLSNALNFDPTVAPYDENGNFGISETITQEIKNPLALIDNSYNQSNTNKLFGKLELQYDIIDGLKLTTRFGYTYTDVLGKNFNPLVYYGVGHNNTNANEDLSPIVTVGADGEVTSTHNRVEESYTNYFTYTYELFGNYNFTVKDDHNIDVVLGFSMGKNTGDNITANAQDIPYNSWNYADVSSATGDPASQTVGSWQYENRNTSFFTRINYDYQGKYLASFTGRVDGSTSFGSNNKYGFFPSGSIGWVASNEDFFESGVVSFLKLRASYGSVGNDNISPQFARISNFPKYTFDGNITSGSTLESISNSDVSWENQIQYDFGVDLKFLNNKISITSDYFIKIVDDLLFDPTLSLYLGTPEYPTTNIGKTRTSGFEFSVGYNDTYGDNLSLSTNLNFTAIESNVEEINNGDKFIWGSGYGIPWTLITRFEEGFTPGYFYGYQTDGVFQNQDEIDDHATQGGAQPGDIRYKDLDGNGVIDGEDRGKIGDPFPDYTIGWNISLDYKNWDFSAFTYASVGQDIYRAYERNLNYTNRYAAVLDRWTGPGTSNSEPRVTFVDTNQNIRASDRYVEDGSFVKIKNLQVGYSLPQSVYNQSGLSLVRFYAQAKNLFVFTKYSGYDPEISYNSSDPNEQSAVMDSGIDRGAYPQPRVWTLGVNIKF